MPEKCYLSTNMILRKLLENNTLKVMMNRLLMLNDLTNAFFPSPEKRMIDLRAVKNAFIQIAFNNLEFIRSAHNVLICLTNLVKLSSFIEC